MGFIRRFPNYPGDDVVSAVGGVAIIDLPPPGSVQGVGTGIAALVGEFPDMTYAVQVTAGVVSRKYRPVQILGTQDLVNKTGSFDATLGDFGVTQGNGFVELRSKKFAGLVLVPINLASAQATRLTRVLPPCKSLTNPQPTLPIAAAAVPAGSTFKSGTSRVLTAARTGFTGDVAFQVGTDGAVTPAGLPAATQPFVAAGAHFKGTPTIQAAQVGDILVPDVFPAATVLTVLMLIGDVTATVASTAGFPATGTIQVESEQMTYGGKTSTSFTGLTRGVNGTAAAAHANSLPVSQVTNQGTYRITALTDTTLTIERMDGTNFTTTNWITATALPWRVHPAAAADTAGLAHAAYATAGGYTLPVRPIDATIAAGAVGQSCTPLPAPPAMTATTWDSLSGLNMLTQNAVGIVFSANLQIPNAGVTNSTDSLAAMDVEYQAAIDSLLSQDFPARTVNIVWAARKRPLVTTKLNSHVNDASAQGITRTTPTSPNLNVVTLTGTTAISEDIASGDASPGVGAQRNERLDYCWPGVTVPVPEAVGVPILLADGTTTIDGNIDLTWDGWVAALLSNLAPERDPGQSASPVSDVLAPIIGLQHGVSGLGINDYALFQQRGITAPRFDIDLGQFISETALTTSPQLVLQSIPRRRMADFIQDSLARAFKPFVKLPISRQFTDGIVGETVAFLEGLLSANNPAAQRILGYTVDEKSGNTTELLKKGIYVLIVRVEILGIARDIVLQTQIGNGVLNIQQAA